MAGNIMFFISIEEGFYTRKYFSTEWRPVMTDPEGSVTERRFCNNDGGFPPKAAVVVAKENNEEERRGRMRREWVWISTWGPRRGGGGASGGGGRGAWRGRISC